MIVVSVILMALAQGAPNVAGRSHTWADYGGTDQAEPIEVAASRRGDTFPWMSEGPLEFLKELRRKRPLRQYLLYGTHVGWIRESDLEALVQLVGSREPCDHVVSSVSSRLPDSRSFVGQEALFLIEGYRTGRYPPRLHSIGFYQEKKDEILAWWKSRDRNP